MLFFLLIVIKIENFRLDNINYKNINIENEFKEIIFISEGKIFVNG